MDTVNCLLPQISCKLCGLSWMELRRKLYKLQTIEKLIAYPSVRYRTQNFPNRGTDNRQRLLALCVGSSKYFVLRRIRI